MNRFFKIFLSLSLLIFTTGCTSYIAAKYDNYNETYAGEAVYSSSYGRASINLTSDINGTICTGSTPFYQGIYVYNFNLICSDGRMITGSMYHGKYEGRAFTNRNETLSFYVSRNRQKVNKVLSAYKEASATSPSLNAKKEPIQVIMQPNKF